MSYKKRCDYCGESLVVKEVAHTLRGPAVSFYKHPACERAMNKENENESDN